MARARAELQPQQVAAGAQEALKQPITVRGDVLPQVYAINSLTQAVLSGEITPTDERFAPHAEQFAQVAEAFDQRPDDVAGNGAIFRAQIVLNAALYAMKDPEARTAAEKRAATIVADGKVTDREVSGERSAVVGERRAQRAASLAAENARNQRVNLGSSMATIEASSLLEEAGFAPAEPEADPDEMDLLHPADRKAALARRVDAVLANIPRHRAELRAYLAEQITAFEQAQMDTVLNPGNASRNRDTEVSALQKVAVALLEHHRNAEPATIDAIHNAYLTALAGVLPDHTVRNKHMLLAPNRHSNGAEVKTGLYKRIASEQEALHQPRIRRAVAAPVILPAPESSASEE